MLEIEERIMFKKLCKTMAFLVIVAMLWSVISIKFRPDRVHPVFCEPENTLDVVMIGSSSWYTFWSPMVAYEFQGITSFDYAQGAMPADCLEYCIREVLKRQEPEVIALDARMFLYRDENTLQENDAGEIYIEDAHIRSVSDTMPYSINRFRMLYSVRDYLEDGLSTHLDLLFYHDRWKEVFAQGGISLHDRTERDYTKGYDLHSEIVPYEGPRDVSGVTETEALSESTETLLRRLCAYCGELDAAVLFVAMPTCDHDEMQQRRYNYMKQIIDEYEGVDFLNTNDLVEEIGIDYATDFYDTTHANYLGTVKFTSWLEDYLTTAYKIPDRRGQEDYAHWQEDLDRWHQMLRNIGQ
ncbi:MAG: hypothetical protein NC254_02065 [bacterium]|nr:hypothetical protein [bacterium]